ncbi:hypothetical protein, partial [Planococcus sp. ISL-110]|uniref:hypothetical protein n=1 Tax=Planococcus sp. ISL-110 TaxID=2819167 RepID=UPI001BEAC574
LGGLKMQNLKAREKIFLLMLITGPILLLLKVYRVINQNEPLLLAFDTYAYIFIFIFALIGYLKTKKELNKKRN